MRELLIGKSSRALAALKESKFPSEMAEENSGEECKIQRSKDHSDPAPGKERCPCFGAVP